MRVMIKSGELRAGDLVHVDGALVRLEGQPSTYPGHAGMTVYHWPSMPVIGTIDMFPHLRVWTIQGNDLANWVVERS